VPPEARNKGTLDYLPVKVELKELVIGIIKICEYLTTKLLTGTRTTKLVQVADTSESLDKYMGR